MDTITQLVALYNQEGWKHFDKWIQEQIQNCIVEIMNPETPVEKIDLLRIQAYVYQSILDKVSADKETLKQMQAQQGN